MCQRDGSFDTFFVWKALGALTGWGVQVGRERL